MYDEGEERKGETVWGRGRGGMTREGRGQDRSGEGELIRERVRLREMNRENEACVKDNCNAKYNIGTWKR